MPAALLAVLLLALTPVSVAARDTYFLSGPPEIRIVGANGEARDFVAVSSQDRRAAAALFQQIRGGLADAPRPIPETTSGLPHYQIGIGQPGLGAVAAIWARLPETTMTYYLAGTGRDFFIVEGQPANRPTAALVIPASPDVSSLIQRHLDNLAPIEVPTAAPRQSTGAWEIALGALVLAGFTALLLEDRRRWRHSGRRSAGSKGT